MNHIVASGLYCMTYSGNSAIFRGTVETENGNGKTEKLKSKN